MQDTNGREYAKLSLLSKGDLVKVGYGFTCLRANSKHVVLHDDKGLFILCDGGHHYLDSQIMHDNDSLIGIYKVEMNRD